MTPEAKLLERGLLLPPPWEPGASLEMFVLDQNLLHLSAHLGVDMSRQVRFHGRDNHHPLIPGRVGANLDLEGAAEAARGGALNLIATIKAALGDLARVARIIRVTSYVNVEPGFAEVHEVADAASDLLIDVFGQAGRHVRGTLGVVGLPGGACYAIDGLVRVREN
jgi:enamine deaminase RidA (YjgF/YER057c/UK114 family)